MLRTILIATAAALLPMAGYCQTPAIQAEDDWELVEAPDRDAILAVISFDNGLRLVSRCVAGNYELILYGLPTVGRSYSRTLAVAHGDDALQDHTWTVGEDRTVAFSRTPARMARRMMQGQQLQVRVPGDGGRPATRYVMAMPESASALARTLSDCGKSVGNARDFLVGDAPDGPPRGYSWTSRPQIDFPSAVRGRLATMGFVTMSCQALPDGRLQDCEVESEHPNGFNFGEAVLRSMRRARVQPNVEVQDPAVVSFTVNFRLD